MVNIFEVNFSSVFLEKIFLELNPTGIKFAATVSFQSIRKIEQILESFKRFNCELSPVITSWCKVAKAHFEQLAYYALYE